MEEKFYRRFESFKNLLDALNEAKTRDLSDSFVLSGTGAKFSITFDLSWKVMKDIIVGYHMVSDFATGSPREVLRKAFAVNLIYDDVWMEMLKVRNEISHDYDGKVMEEHCNKIVNVYIDKFYELVACVEKMQFERI